ncbi:DUF892 family protein [Pedobacter frigiditerrae]|uniref:DUF892 family protein n=1 Tax=Pedobacter frigiditerrae TaxID=2530452 RepID=UPI00292EC484|nr:DUF892 family protein [Pedobacter frigiditerrae]
MPKELPKPQAILLNHFVDGLLALIAIEQQFAKLYAKLEKASLTAELSKALTPEISDQVQHISRLKLIHTALNLGKLVVPKVNEGIPILKLSTKKSAPQDLQIIHCALKLQNLKLAYYELLHPLAKGLALATEATLLEQTMSDNRNTSTWLRQIIQNVIATILNE